MRPAQSCLLPALALAITAASPSFAADPAAPAIEQAFGNTVVSTYPDGRTGLLWLKADGSYSAKGRRRTASSGTWSIKKAQVCLKQLKPTRGPFTYCTPLPSSQTWFAKAVTGERISLKILQGVREP